MDTVEPVVTPGRTLYKMTGMPNLEELGSQQAAEAQAKQFGWVAPPVDGPA